MVPVQADSATICRVVIIDDSADDRAEVRRLLLHGSDRRYSFFEAETGTTGVALVLAAVSLPDCVLLDYNLPDMDAVEVLMALAGSDGLPVCPVVVLTGGAGPEARRSVLRAGAQDYVGKDWSTPTGLTWVVENAIERLAMARQLLLRDEALRRNETALSEADRRKDEFIATLAHELRNPLAPVRTGLGVLRLTRDPVASVRTLDIMERQLGHMTRLIDDLLDISRVTSGKVLLRFKRLAVRALIDAAAEAALPVMEAGRHSLIIDMPEHSLWLDADHDRLVQVVGNLLNNSAKYSQDGGQIRLAARLEGAMVVIEVSDLGLGIPEEMLDQVFDMFTQVNSALDRSQGGLGIGLALAKRLVGMHGGTIVAQSPGANAGSTFTIRLPGASAPLQDLTVARSENGAHLLPARRVLVVDDNADGADLLAMMLGLSGHETRIAYSGTEALAAAADFRPDVTFLDIGLPGMNGYEVARRFRAIPAFSPMLLVALTGWGSEEDRRRSQEAGFDIHLTKPVEPSSIDDVMARFGLPLEDGAVAAVFSGSSSPGLLTSP